MWRVVLVALVVVSGAYFVARLLYMVSGSAFAVSRATLRARRELNGELVSLSTEEIRTRLLQDGYLSDYLRADAGVQELLSRIAQRDEVSLARQYPKAKLYRLFARAEKGVRGRGRPEAVDAVEEVSVLLQELARRNTARRTRLREPSG